ncbi:MULTISPECIES: hypothetical protein [Pasteurellaceae]|uniref:Uncharacterized protein n=1 Tax=Glaesserella australis TaxID=2094024 RepID=A0A328BWB0_9PAST|nr:MULTISPECIES: hypothetical protein [Pasteurellaceae]AUI65853.1 hypothetical protein CJD39_04370 [Glaesserella sp. 15-184]RAL18001.1 hypothetical protein C5N92_10210 [Glaesserella australis]
MNIEAEFLQYAFDKYKYNPIQLKAFCKIMLRQAGGYDRSLTEEQKINLLNQVKLDLDFCMQEIN